MHQQRNAIAFQQAQPTMMVKALLLSLCCFMTLLDNGNAQHGRTDTKDKGCDKFCKMTCIEKECCDFSKVICRCSPKGCEQPVKSNAYGA